MAVGRDYLDTIGCALPGCRHDGHDGLFLLSKCHTKRGTEVEYRSGVLHIRCCHCKKPIVEVKVAAIGDLLI